MSVRVLPIILAAFAFWPLLPWYCQRLSDGSEDSLGLLALVTALALVLFGQLNRRSDNAIVSVRSTANWVSCSGLLIAYILLLHHAPNLVLAIVMVLTLWLFLDRYLSVNSSSALLGLLLLSLPIISSMNFFLGYPLRLGIAHIVSGMLATYGFAVNVNGTSLNIGGQEVSIDAPCSGVHFLWFSAYLALLLAHMERANFLRTAGLLSISAVCAILGNIFRSLFVSVTCAFGYAWLASNSYVHEGIGALSFCLTAALIITMSKLSRRRVIRQQASGFPQLGFAQVGTAFSRPMKVFYCVLCVVAASTPLVAARSVDPSLAIKPDPWHERADENHLTRIPLSLVEKRFQIHFPGQIAKFSDGKSEIVFRNIYSATRQLHPADDCLRGTGYKVSKEYLTKDLNGAVWHTLIANNGSKQFEVKERILDHHGQSWARVSDWYWAAMLGQTKGPWLSITKAQAVTGS